KFLLVELVPMFTLLFAVLFRHRVDYVFDHAVFALYFVTVTMWLDWLIVPTVALAGLKAATWLGFGGLEEPTHWIVTAWAPVLITLVYVYVGANRFYGGSKRENFLRASIAASLYHVLVNLY